MRAVIKIFSSATLGLVFMVGGLRALALLFDRERFPTAVGVTPEGGLLALACALTGLVLVVSGLAFIRLAIVRRADTEHDGGVIQRGGLG